MVVCLNFVRKTTREFENRNFLSNLEPSPRPKPYGPFNSIEELKKQTDEWNVVFPEKWYRTSPDPNMMDESSQRKDKKK